MAYQSGSFSEPTNPASVFMTLLDGVITSHSNWSFVEEINDGGTGVCRVYKVLAAGSSAAVDCYVLIRRTATTATSISIAIAETYNLAPTSTIAAFAPAVSNTLSQGCYIAPGAGGVTSLAAQAVFTLTHVMWRSVSLSTSPIPYWISVNNDRLVIATSNTVTSATAVYAGAFTPYPGVTDSSPFILSDMPNIGGGDNGASIASDRGAYTRTYLASGANRNNWQASFDGITATPILSNSQTPVKNPASNEWSTMRILLCNRANNQTTVPNNVTHEIKGYLSGVVAIFGSTSAIAKDDRLLIGTDYWVGVSAATSNSRGMYLVNSSE